MSEAQENPLRVKRRTAILEAADRLFKHYGFEKTTVADIAHAARIGVGSVYLEFDSKETVARELSKRCHDHVLTAMRHAASAEESFARRLRATFDARATHFWEVASTGPHALELVSPGTCSGTALERERFEEAEQALLIELLEAGDAAGELRIVDAPASAGVLLRIYATYAPPRLFEQDPAETKRILAATHELVVHGLLRRA
ncbi:MAG: TetR/AcrR family transcriptional regulator [Myxococcota bacterium]